MDYELSKHAQRVLKERKIPIKWLEKTLSNPGKKEMDDQDVSVKNYFYKIPEFGNRVLKVVVNHLVKPQKVVGVYFDRTMKGKL